MHNRYIHCNNSKNCLKIYFFSELLTFFKNRVSQPGLGNSIGLGNLSYVGRVNGMVNFLFQHYFCGYRFAKVSVIVFIFT